MAAISFTALREPVSAEEPCGPDLELLGDGDFFQFDAQIALVLPESFVGFDRREADIPQHLPALGALLDRSRDLRLLVTLAKLMVLERDLPAFTEALELIAHLLAERWDTLNPALMDGDAALRLVALQSLDDMPHMAQPLQAAPLLKSRRLGFVSLRSQLLAEGKVQPRALTGDSDGEMEKVPGPSDIQATVRENDLPVILETLALAERICAAIDTIIEVFHARSGAPGTLKLARTRQVAQELRVFVEQMAADKDPSRAATAPAAQEGAEPAEGAVAVVPVAVGALRSRTDVRAALDAAIRYFALNEPSSPVRMVLLQVNDLYGKSFYDALVALAPDLVRQAEVRPVRDMALSLPVERLAALLTPGEDMMPESAGWNEEGGADESGPAPFEAGSRAEALGLISAVSAFLRQSEPSSPLPLILDYAKSITGRDFLGLLQEVLPANALRPSEY